MELYHQHNNAIIDRDALAIALMKKKKFSKFDFKRFHPSGSHNKLKTAGDLMLVKTKFFC